MSEFDRVIGYEDVKAELIRICDVIVDPEKYRKLGAVTPKGVLLHGEPGIGKTLMALSFIREAGRKTLTIRKDKPNGGFVEHIRQVFEEAKSQSPSIVFLDDLDKFADEEKKSKNEEEYVVVQSCIDDVKDDEVFVIATANDIDLLPDSLIRNGRFDKVIEMVAPKGKEAEKIISFYLKDKKIVPDVDTGEISRLMEGRTCADLETVVNEAAIYAAYKGKEIIEQDDIVQACMRIIFDAPECVEQEDHEFLRNIAVHEAGHAVIGEILAPGSVNIVSIYQYSGSVKGILQAHENENMYLSKRLLENKVIRLLGGKAATEMVYGVSDPGTNSDLHKAFSMVEKFVDHYCSYSFDSFTACDSSPYLFEMRDRRISYEIERYYQTAKQIIAENRSFLDAIVDELMDKKTLTCRDIERIRNEYIKAA